MKGRISERRGEVTIVKRAQLALLFCGIEGTNSILEPLRPM
jgi:hypothetical protein